MYAVMISIHDGGVAIHGPYDVIENADGNFDVKSESWHVTVTTPYGYYLLEQLDGEEPINLIEYKSDGLLTIHNDKQYVLCLVSTPEEIDLLMDGIAIGARLQYRISQDVFAKQIQFSNN